MNITDRIKTFEDACLALNLDPTHLPIVDLLPEKDRKSIIAYYKLTIIIRALNEGWEPNWWDNNETKFYNYFDCSSGSGFVYSDTYFTVTDASVGSRLCFNSRYLAVYALSQFRDLYEDYLLVK
jgi:hypothetical protein